MEYPEGTVTVTKNGNIVLYSLAATAVGIGFIVSQHLSTPFDAIFESIGSRYKIDPNLLRAFAKKESNMNPSAVSPANKNGTRDYGLMQVNDANFVKLGLTRETALIPPYNVEAAAKLLVSLRGELGDKLSLHTLISAYNAGSPAVKNRGIFNLPYVEDVLLHYQLYSLGRAFA